MSVQFQKLLFLKIGDLSSTEIDLTYNFLTTFDYEVFYDVLTQMEGGSGFVDVLASKQTFRPETGQLQFAICQGAIFEDLRRESAEFIASNNFDGHAIGGLAVGESKEEREHFTAFAAGLLPDAKPRYLMGVGTPHDLIRSVRAGIDMFDCIIPTNHAKQGVAYTWSGKVKLRRSVYADHKRPLEDGCDCTVCTRYSCAYLYQMFKSGEPAAWRYVSLHNLWFYKKLMSRTRNEIASGSFAKFSSWFLNEVPEI